MRARVCVHTLCTIYTAFISILRCALLPHRDYTYNISIYTFLCCVYLIARDSKMRNRGVRLKALSSVNVVNIKAKQRSPLVVTRFGNRVKRIV